MIKFHSKALAIFLAIGILTFHRSAFGQFSNPLFIPDTLQGPVFNLQIKSSQKSFFSGLTTDTKSFNTQNFLGPTLIFRRGWNIQATVTNSLTDTTTLHWHGLHLPAHADGGPHSPIIPGAQWNAHFTCLDKAGTYWYHPHFHGKTGEHTLQGAAGLMLVRDAEESLLSLPRKYGIDDFPLIIQSLQFDPNGKIIPRGFQDSTLLLNGTLKPVLSVPAQWVRFRLVNASNARNFNIAFSNDLSFYLIGNDAGLLGRPLSRTRVRLAPGERVEIVFNFQNFQGQNLFLRSLGSEILQGVQGGPIGFPPPGTPPMNSPLNGADFDLIRFSVGDPTQGAVLQISDSLATQNRISEGQSEQTRNLVFSAVAQGSWAGPFLLNDSSFNMERIDFEIPVNRTEIWNIHNQTPVAHPFHLHGFSFYILDRYGAPVEPDEAGKKDVVLINPNEQVRIITRFSDFADASSPYMFHCHLLSHEDDGMMSQFVVAPLVSNTSKESTQTEIGLPNPFSNDLILIKNKNQFWALYDIFGIKMAEGCGEKRIKTTDWPIGIYYLNIEGKTQKLIKKE